MVTYRSLGFLGSKPSDLYVTIQIGGADTESTKGGALAVGGQDIVIPGSQLTMNSNGTITAPVPAGALVGGSYIVVTRTEYVPLNGQYGVQGVPSNAVQLLPTGFYSVAVNSGDGTVSVIDGTTATEAARISLGANTAPRNAVITQDGTRAYIALNGGAGIAVIDLVSLQEVDADPNKPGIQYILLRPSAQPFDLVAESSGRYLYVSDAAQGAIYVVDIDPFSKTFNQHIKTIPVGPAPLGLRGIALNSDNSLLFATAPGQTIFGAYGATTGSLLVIQTNVATRQAPAFLSASASLSGVISVGPEPYDITGTNDPNVMLFVDRMDDTRGVGVLRRVQVGSDFIWQENYISLVPFGINPRLIEGRDTQVFGVSNADSIVFMPANALTGVTFNGVVMGPHPAYAFITGYNKFVVGDPKHDPALGPVSAYNYYFTDPKTGQLDDTELFAGGNVGIIRNPLGDPTNPETMPRVVAATSPIANSFPEGISLSTLMNPQTKLPAAVLLMAGFQAQNRLFIYNAGQMVYDIENEAQHGSFIPSFSQIGEPTVIPADLSHLLRGPLSTVPIDVVYPDTNVKSVFGYYYDPVAKQLVYGAPVPAVAPLLLGRLPRGVASTPLNPGTPLLLTPTPYNETPTLDSYPNQPLTVEAGFTATADAVTGAYQDSHPLVGYFDMGSENLSSLTYNSLAAQANYIYYFSVGAIPQSAAASTLIVRLTVRDDQGNIATAAGLSAADAVKLGLSGGEMFFSLPATIPAGQTFGAGIPIDLSKLPTGLYTVQLDYGLFNKDPNGKYTIGRFFTFSEPYAVVNRSDGIFGAGWSLTGITEIFAGDNGVLLTNGNGSAEIYLAPAAVGDPFTSLSMADSSVLIQLSDGTFELQLRGGSSEDFDSKGKLQSLTDRNGNPTLYSWSGNQLISITDSVGLVTQFNYTGKRVTSILNPDHQVTQLAYDGNGNLVSITDPDGAQQTYDYAETDFQHLITSQTLPRGNDPLETSGLHFDESVLYDKFGRVIGGTRVDGKTFTLDAAQGLAVVDLTKGESLDPTKPYATVLLSTQ